MPIRRAISAVLPVSDRREQFIQAVERLRAALAACSEEHEIVLVDDGRAGRLPDDVGGESSDVRVIRVSSWGDGSASLRDGFLAARLPLVLQADTESGLDPGDIPRLLELIDKFDIVIGYPHERRGSPLRRLSSWCTRQIMATVFGVYVHDAGCALKLYRRKVFKHIPIESRSAFVDAEILAKANVLGYRIGETPVSHLSPADGRAPARSQRIGAALGDAWRMLHTFNLQPDRSVQREEANSSEPDRIS